MGRVRAWGDEIGNFADMLQLVFTSVREKTKTDISQSDGADAQLDELRVRKAGIPHSSQVAARAFWGPQGSAPPLSSHRDTALSFVLWAIDISPFPVGQLVFRSFRRP